MCLMEVNRNGLAILVNACEYDLSEQFPLSLVANEKWFRQEGLRRVE